MGEHLIAADLGPGSQGRDSNQALEKGTQGHTYAGLTDHAPAPFQGSPLARRPGDREDGYTSLLHVHWEEKDKAVIQWRRGTETNPFSLLLQWLGGVATRSPRSASQALLHLPRTCTGGSSQAGAGGSSQRVQHLTQHCPELSRPVFQRLCSPSRPIWKHCLFPPRSSSRSASSACNVHTNWSLSLRRSLLSDRFFKNRRRFWKTQDGIACNYKVIGVIESAGSYANHPPVFNFTSRLFLFLNAKKEKKHPTTHMCIWVWHVCVLVCGSCTWNTTGSCGAGGTGLRLVVKPLWSLHVLEKVARILSAFVFFVCRAGSMRSLPGLWELSDVDAGAL